VVLSRPFGYGGAEKTRGIVFIFTQDLNSDSAIIDGWVHVRLHGTTLGRIMALASWMRRVAVLESEDQIWRVIGPIEARLLHPLEVRKQALRCRRFTVEERILKGQCIKA